MENKKKEEVERIQKKVRKKIKRKNYLQYGCISASMFGVFSLLYLIPGFLSKEKTLEETIGLLFVVILFGFILGAGFVNSVLEDEIRTEIKKEKEKIFHTLASQTELYAVSALYSYRDLQDVYEKGTETNLSLLQSNIKKRNQDLLHCVRESIIEDCEKQITCSICGETIEVRNDTITKACSCKSLRAYQEEKKELF